MSHIKANQGQEILKSKISEYPTFTEEQVQVMPKIVTGQHISGERFGMDTMIHGIYRLSPVADLVEAGSTRRVIKATAHGMKKNDFLQFSSGANIGQEIQVLSVPDVDTVVLASNLEVAPSIGDQFFKARSVSPRYTSDGDLNVSSGPARFTLDAVDTLVQEDTAVPANNKPMPSGMMIKKDGVYTPVELDTTNPYAHTPIPVVITDVTGTAVVNVTASDLNVSIKHNGTDPSSVRIGDGTETANVNASNELQVADDTARTHLSTLAGTVVGSEVQVDIVSSALPSGAATSANQTTEIGHLATLAGAVAGTEVQVDVLSSALPTGAATSANQTTIIGHLDGVETGLGNLLTELQLKADLTETQPVSAASLPLPTGASTSANQTTIIGHLDGVEGSLSNIDGKLPSTLGQKTMANSLAVVLSSDQPTLTVKKSALTGSFAEITNLTTVQTFTAPANAIGAKIMADDTNAANVRFKQGAVATASSGLQLQAGRSEDLGNGSDISVCAESGTLKVMVIWNIQA